MNSKEKLLAIVTSYVNRHDQPLNDIIYAESQLSTILHDYLVDNHIDNKPGNALATMFQESISALEFISHEETNSRVNNFIMLSEYFKV